MGIRNYYFWSLGIDNPTYCYQSHNEFYVIYLCCFCFLICFCIYCNLMVYMREFGSEFRMQFWEEV